MEQDALPLARSPGVWPRWLHAVRIVHPFPTLLNVAATAGLVLVATDGSPDRLVLARMLIAMAFVQSAIGVTNDLFDRDLDAATKPWKPLVAGAVQPSMAKALAVALIVAAAVIGATLGLGSVLLLLLGMACGLAYDVRLKRTAWSALPFMIAIPTLPVWVWVTVGEWEAALWWVLPLGALLGLSLHLANTLPDVESDAAHGVRGLAHRLGRMGSGGMAWASFAVALGITALLAPLLDYELKVYVPAAAFAGGCLVASMLALLARRSEGAMQFGWAAIALGSAVVAVGWLASLT